MNTYLRALSAGTPAGTAAMGRWRLRRRGAACDCVSCATHAETWHSVVPVCEAGVCVCVNHMSHVGSRESGGRHTRDATLTGRCGWCGPTAGTPGAAAVSIDKSIYNHDIAQDNTTSPHTDTNEQATTNPPLRPSHLRASLPAQGARAAFAQGASRKPPLFLLTRSLFLARHLVRP